MNNPPQPNFQHIIKLCNSIEQLDLTDKTEIRILNQELDDTIQIIHEYYRENYSTENHAIQRKNRYLLTELISNMKNWLNYNNLLDSDTETETSYETTDNSTGSR